MQSPRWLHRCRSWRGRPRGARQRHGSAAGARSHFWVSSRRSLGCMATFQPRLGVLVPPPCCRAAGYVAGGHTRVVCLELGLAGLRGIFESAAQTLWVSRGGWLCARLGAALSMRSPGRGAGTGTTASWLPYAAASAAQLLGPQLICHCCRRWRRRTQATHIAVAVYHTGQRGKRGTPALYFLQHCARSDRCTH